jgi:glycosyltransferase involved in cell wall biosynthesis
MGDRFTPWICCQIGAREHYAIPRALQATHQLAQLFTDAWVPPQSGLQNIPGTPLKALQERFHPDLAHANIQAFTLDLLRFELTQRLTQKADWDLIIARNHWFQNRVIQRLKAIAPQLRHGATLPILFAYSYAALQIIRYAKQQGWRVILGQIDPGPREEQIVQQEHLRYPDLAPHWTSAPSSYWQDWHQECALADRIIVNSTWSQQALLQVGIPDSKITIIPLAYNPPVLDQTFERHYPPAFSAERPLRVLFLGQIILRKGVAALFDAIQQLRHAPIEFWFVGSPGITPPEALSEYKNLRWIGTVSRSTVAQYYRDADVFIFPTLSDGFGLTQLEAQAWKLPLIVSPFCGTVAIDHQNGLRLTQVTGAAIANALQYCLDHPQQLAAFSKHSVRMEPYSLEQLRQHLTTVFQHGA